MGKFFDRNPQTGPVLWQGGQILLVVVLAAVISLTVGLSAVSRIITNTRVTTEEANSQRALSAAEAGVDELVKETNPPPRLTKQLSNNSNFDARTTAISGTQILVNDGSTIFQDDGADVWLSDYPSFTNPRSLSLTIYWTDTPNFTNCNQNPAIEVAIISGADKTNPNMTRYAYDSCQTRGNNFQAASRGNFTILGESFQNRTTAPISIINGYIARIIPLYADTKIAVVASSALPSQGNVIDSVGYSGDTTRRVRVYQGFPRLPIEFFPYNLFLP